MENLPLEWNATMGKAFGAMSGVLSKSLHLADFELAFRQCCIRRDAFTFDDASSEDTAIRVHLMPNELQVCFLAPIPSFSPKIHGQSIRIKVCTIATLRLKAG